MLSYLSFHIFRTLHQNQLYSKMANDVSRPAVASTIFLSSNGKPFAIAAAGASESNISMLSTPNNTGIIILKGATVIDGTGDLPRPNTTIVINGSRIAALSSNATAHSDFRSFAAKNIIDLTGKYIIPGLFDMHAHVANVLKNSYNQSESEYMLSILLAYGVTTIRNTGGPTEQSVDLKKMFLRENSLAPKYLRQDGCLTPRRFKYRL
jgi:hypothetical protein